MVIFYGYVKLPEGNHGINIWIKYIPSGNQAWRAGKSPISHWSFRKITWTSMAFYGPWLPARHV